MHRSAALLGMLSVLASLTLAGRVPEEPASAPVVTPDADGLLNQIRDAYANVKSLQLAGTIAFDSEIMGQRETKSLPFTAAFDSPNRFRHEIKDQNLVVCTGEKAFLFVPRLRKYVESAAPADRETFDKVDEQIRSVVQLQNPSLYLALVANARDDLLSGASRASTLADEQVGGVPMHVLCLEQELSDMKCFIDARSKLLRRVEFDQAKLLASKGVPDVKRATITIDYGQVNRDAHAAGETFAWAPPSDASPALDVSADDEGAIHGPDRPHPLVGKPAPEFALPGLDGKNVKLAELRGSVVVLDFWATWCGPCREGLPHLEKLRGEFEARGVKVFAVNLREPKDKATQFMREQKLDLHVLLDENGEVGEKYGVQGIPQTVVIGKRGIVTRVLIGFDPASTEGALRNSIEQSLNE